MLRHTLKTNRYYLCYTWFPSVKEAGMELRTSDWNVIWAPNKAIALKAHRERHNTWYYPSKVLGEVTSKVFDSLWLDQRKAMDLTYKSAKRFTLVSE